MAGKYSSLNVLSTKPRNDYMSDDCISDVANMLKASGENRSQRRRLERSLRNMQTIMAHTQKHVDDSAYREYQKAVDKNYVHFFACLGLCMLEQYNWKEDETHNQLESLFIRVDKTIEKYANQGLETEDIVNILEEKTGIKLIPDAH